MKRYLTEELSLMALKCDPNLNSNMRNLMDFNSSSRKSENLHFDEIFL